MSSGFGTLEPLLAPRSVAVVGASDREGNLGGLAVGFLAKFGYRGPVWAVNPSGGTVRGQRAYANLRDLPGVPDLAIVAVPAGGVASVVRDCADVGTPAAIAWAGGFAEIGPEGATRQRELEALCRDTGVKLCGPNCIGVINTSIGLTASFSSMLADNATLTPGTVSMVSQSGGIGVMSHARAQAFGLGFRITVSCGNEASVTLPDVMRALVDDDGTRVVAVYVEGLSDPDGFVEALAAARRRDKPVVVMKGGASEASGRAALAHTGRLAGSDRIFDAIFREFAVSRVGSAEELLDVALQLASTRPEQMPQGRRVLVSTFGGGSGVVCTDQCAREGLLVPALSSHTRERVAPLCTPLSSVANPVDFTPGMVTDARHREKLPQALEALADAPDVDGWVFLAAGFAKQADELAVAFDAIRNRSTKPICLSWQAMP
ncbi:MAG TPA: CoA-binding protein, partial [Casimicrobiaceae bacterium]